MKEYMRLCKGSPGSRKLVLRSVMPQKKSKMNHFDKKYYILDMSSAVVPVEDYKFGKQEESLKLLVNSECFFSESEDNNQKNKLEKMINEIGFEWDPLSEPGHMRQISQANTIVEAIRGYCWQAVKKFCDEQDLLLYRVSGGELLDTNVPEIKKQVLSISRSPGLYGSNLYNVIINKKKRVLRYNACLQKLKVAKELNLREDDLPVGFFEISKSYRFEDERNLRLGKTLRCFHIPELDVIHSSSAASLKMALAAHENIFDDIKKLDPECGLLCNVTPDFFKENFDFLKTIVRSINKPILLAVYGDAFCKDGVKIDIEYKVFDSLRSPVEIATCLVGDGDTEFSLDLEFQTKNGIKKPVSILHIVFPFGSVERFAYFLLDRAIKEEEKNGFGQLPFWVSPIQVRIIAYDEDSSEDARKLARELDSMNFRVDLDDREIPYSLKKKTKDLKWIPYIVTVGRSGVGLQNIRVENKEKGLVWRAMKKGDLIKKLKTEGKNGITAPRYVPMALSKRLDFSAQRAAR